MCFSVAARTGQGRDLLTQAVSVCFVAGNVKAPRHDHHGTGSAGLDVDILQGKDQRFQLHPLCPGHRLSSAVGIEPSEIRPAVYDLCRAHSGQQGETKQVLVGVGDATYSNEVHFALWADAILAAGNHGCHSRSMDQVDLGELGPIAVGLLVQPFDIDGTKALEEFPCELVLEQGTRVLILPTS